jgi:hypothetical protein
VYSFIHQLSVVKLIFGCQRFDHGEFYNDATYVLVYPLDNAIKDRVLLPLAIFFILHDFF